MTLSRPRLALILALALGLGALWLAVCACAAERLGDDGGAEWHLEQPAPPAPAVTPSEEETSEPHAPIGLGSVSDIEFEAPNRGALITAGNGTTIPAGVWIYNGEHWHELASVCGASDAHISSDGQIDGEGRIAWAGPDEFWTISDGRPGQTTNSKDEAPPLQDDTLCHFAVGPSGDFEVVGSYASPAFKSTSYLAMDAAACLSPSDCWFAGEALTAPQIGAFELHWNGRTVTTEPYLPEGHAVGDVAEYGGSLYQSFRLLESDRKLKYNQTRLPPLLRVNAEGSADTFEPVLKVPLYGEGEFAYALEYLHLGSDEDALWAAGGPVQTTPEKSNSAGVTIDRYSRIQAAGEGGYVEEGSPSWTQVLGPETTPDGKEVFPGEQVPTSIAAEPGTDSAWVSTDTLIDQQQPQPTTSASLVRVSADGTISDQLSLPAAGEAGAKGAGEKIVCPATHDCWMVSTQGWLFHLSTTAEREQLEGNGDPAFSREYLITYRPPDESVPQELQDAPPENDSGLEEGAPPTSAMLEPALANPFATVTVPLLSDVHTRLVHRTTLELRFRLSVKASVRLIAKRRRKVVASTPTRTFAAGGHSLLLHLNVHRWPTKLNLQTHALAPLKTASTREGGSNTNTVSTSLVFPDTQSLIRSSQTWSGLGW